MQLLLFLLLLQLLLLLLILGNINLVLAAVGRYNICAFSSLFEHGLGQIEYVGSIIMRCACRLWYCWLLTMMEYHLIKMHIKLNYIYNIYLFEFSIKDATHI